MMNQYKIARLQEIYQKGQRLSLEELFNIAREGFREVDRREAERRSRDYREEFNNRRKLF